MIKPNNTSASKIPAAHVLCPNHSKVAAERYASAWIGRKWFHHILSPPVSNPVVLQPMIQIVANPMPINVRPIINIGDCVVRARYTSASREPMHPVMKRTIRWCFEIVICWYFQWTKCIDAIWCMKDTLDMGVCVVIRLCMMPTDGTIGSDVWYPEVSRWATIYPHRSNGQVPPFIKLHWHDAASFSSPQILLHLTHCHMIRPQKSSSCNHEQHASGFLSQSVCHLCIHDTANKRELIRHCLAITMFNHHLLQANWQDPSLAWSSFCGAVSATSWAYVYYIIYIMIHTYIIPIHHYYTHFYNRH